MPNCPSCGARQLEARSRFCHRCGDALARAESETPRRWFSPGLVLLLVIALASGLLSVALYQGLRPAALISNLGRWRRSARASLGQRDRVSPTRHRPAATPTRTAMVVPTKPSQPCVSLPADPGH